MKLAVLECPHRTLGRSKFARELFTSILTLRFSAFSTAFSENVLPASTLDFIADHILLYDGTIEDMVPIAALKMVDFQICDGYKLSTPVTEWLLDLPDKSYLERFHRYTQSMKKRFAYAGSLAINSGYIQDRETLINIRSIMPKAIAKYSMLKAIDECFAVATPTSKKFLETNLGCEKFFSDKLDFYAYNSTMYVVTLKKENDTFIRLSGSDLPLWEDRYHIYSNVDDQFFLHSLDRGDTRSNHPQQRHI